MSLPELPVGVFKCPECFTLQKFRGLCRPCKQRIRLARKAAKEMGTDPGRVAPGRDPASLPKRSHRTKIKPQSDKSIVRNSALKAIKTMLAPFVTECLRCGQPNPAGTGFKSKSNPKGLEGHHWARRRGFFFFIVVPLCDTCHREVELDGNQSRSDRWVIKEPIKKLNKQ